MLGKVLLLSHVVLFSAAVRAGPVQCHRSHSAPGNATRSRLSTLLAGPFVQALRLVVPGGSLDVGSRHYLKLLPDDGDFIESDCGSTSCEDSHCHVADQVSADVLTWSRVQINDPGWYAACYCEVSAVEGCQGWSHLGSQLVDGVQQIQSRSAVTGHSDLSIAPMLPFELQLRGFNLDDSIRVLFGPGVDCADGQEVFPESLPGGAIQELRVDGPRCRLLLPSPHGLAAGDVLHLLNVGSALSDGNATVDPKCLVESPMAVLAVPSASELLLDIHLDDDQLDTLDLSNASWQAVSRLTFQLRTTTGHDKYSVCWAEPKFRLALLDVVEPPQFLSELHLTTSLPNTVAPSVLAFQSNERAPAVVTRLAISFRDPGVLGHTFLPSRDRQDLSEVLHWASPRQDICGLLFRELWSEDEEGFPQPGGCYFNQPFAEYGMVFPAGSGLKAGVKYQVVMFTQLHSTFYTDHEWEVLEGMAPTPAVGPEEALGGSDLGDLGAVPGMLSCREACARLSSCTVATFRRSDDHCVVADLSRRQKPRGSQASAGSVTMFLLARRPRRIAADLWSLTQEDGRPHAVLEASHAPLVAVPARRTLPVDPQWHPSDGLRVVDPLAADEAVAGPWSLAGQSPQLALRLRMAQQSRFQSGDLLRLYLWPLTAWDLPLCEAQCVTQTAGSCGNVPCHSESLVKRPFRGQRNVVDLVMPEGMETITDVVTHTFLLGGPHFQTPPGGFMPSRLAAELLSESQRRAQMERRVSYTESVGLLPYVPLQVVGGVVQTSGDAAFAEEVRRDLWLRFRLGSMLHSGTANLSAAQTIQLPVGYRIRSVGAPVDLLMLSSTTSQRSAASAALLPQLSAGSWLCHDRSCTFTLSEGAAIYTGYITVHFLVDNPSVPLKINFAANRWRFNLSGCGDADSLVALPRQTLTPTMEAQGTTAGSASVLGRLTLASLIPVDLWQGAFRSLVRIFFRTQQGWSGAGAVLITVPPSFGFDDPCVVQDLPAESYEPRQGLLGSSTSMEQEVATITVHPLQVTRCLGRRASSLAPHGNEFLSQDRELPPIAELYTEGPILEATMYGFAIFMRYTATAMPGGEFHLATHILSADGHWEALDSTSDVPLMTKVMNTAELFSEAATLSSSVEVTPMLPFAFTGAAATVHMLLRPPVVNATAWEKVSWRVFAPHTFVWDFEEYNFYFRHSQIPGADTDLPIARIPPMPRSQPLNLLLFEGTDEASPGWQPEATYGFRAGVRVPTQTPRHSVNEWVIEWGSGDPINRRAAAIAQGAQVRAIHSFRVWCVGSRVQGLSSEILLQFGTVTEVPVGGAFKLRMPSGFIPELWQPSTHHVRCEPFQPVKVPLNLSVDNETNSLWLEPLSDGISPGRWCFTLLGPLPSEVTPPDVVPSPFILESVLPGNQAADVAAQTDGFRISRALAKAALVHDVNYSLTGRDDHPDRASRLIFAFELQSRLRLVGNLPIEVVAPENFTFHRNCSVKIGTDIFGTGGYPRPLVPFDPGVQVLSCRGNRNMAQMQVTPALMAGRRYAFSLRVDAQPESTPKVGNHWFLNVADEASAFPIPGFILWSFLDVDLNFLVQTTATDNEVTILFRPSNTMTSKDHLDIEAPQGFQVPQKCHAEIQQLSGMAATFQPSETDVPLPGVLCQGQQPPNHHFQVRTAAVLARGVRYRLTVGVRNPDATSSSVVPPWRLRSFRQDGQLLDVATVPSLPLAPAFERFEVSWSNVTAADVAVKIQIRLGKADASDVLIITAPSTFQFQAANGCRVQELPDEMLTPECRGPEVRFNFSALITEPFEVVLHSSWPTVSLSEHDAFRGRLEKDNVTIALGRAPLNRAFAPRFANFSLQRSSNIWANALSSIGDLYLTFTCRQRAEVIQLSSRLISAPHLGIDLLSAFVEVERRDFAQQPEVFHVSTSQLWLSGRFQAQQPVAVLLRNVANPQVVGRVVWSLRSFSRPPLPGTLVTAAQAAQGPEVARAAAGQVENLSAVPREAPSFEEIQRWLDWDSRGRDEIADYEATPVHGLLVITNSFLEGHFFDFKGTEVSFEMSLRPDQAEIGHRFLIFAPQNWSFVPGTFHSQGFETQDLGILDCLQQLPAVDQSPRLVSVYALRLLDEGLSRMIPCRFNEAILCENSLTFGFQADTPATPVELDLWQQSSQAWLLQVDAHTGDGCGPHGNELDATLLRFTNDALFRGFALKESLGLRVVPQLNGGPNVPRKATIVTVYFECRSPLVAQGVVLLRVEAPLGLEFDRGCLADPLDPAYVGCAGLGRVAVAQRREVALLPGAHDVSLRAINPVRTVAENWWTLSAYADVPLATAQEGGVEELRQRGRSEGYILAQDLEARVRPSSQQALGPVSIFLWLRPHMEVSAGGLVELHAAQGFEMSCQPALVLLDIPPGRCRKYHVTSGLEYTDDHDVIDFQIAQGHSLLPSHEYQLSVSSRNPSSSIAAANPSSWGVLLRDAARQVLEANMEIASYELTDFGFELLSLQPSTSAPNASNEVRLQLRFQKQLLLGQPISEIRIEAPKAWNFEPFCNLYQDITGGCETRCSFQLPYAEERGHHLCEENVLILVLDTFGVIGVTAFVLLFSVVNPAEAPSHNFWSVSLANSFDSQRVKFTELLIPGFFIGNRQSFLPALPLNE